MAVKNINKEIIEVIKKSGQPISTREVALQVQRAWHTVLTACLRLQIEGKLDGFKAGNMHLWKMPERSKRRY